MIEDTPQSTEQPSYLDMSDEELMKLNGPVGEVSSEPVVQNSTEDTEDKDEETQTQTASTSAPDQADLDDAADEADAKAEDPVKPVEKVTAPVVAETKAEVTQEKATTNTEVDYKTEYQKIFTPFKANGKEITVASAEDAISLMQMGANYTKKMAALKPNLKLMKMLENSGLLSEEKIGFLIDLDKKNPEAINKLIKDSGIDPMEIDTDKATGYKPTVRTVDDRELELDAVLDEIQGTPSYAKMLDIVSSKWDASSKQAVAQTPQLLKVINAHVQSGIYDMINKEVERERMFGRLNGLSDIEAYRQVGDAIQARGGFDSAKTEQQAPAVAQVAPQKSKVDEDKLKEKRRAASPTKPAASSSVAKDFNPLAMSDDEFSKSVINKYL